MRVSGQDAVGAFSVCRDLLGINLIPSSFLAVVAVAPGNEVGALIVAGVIIQVVYVCTEHQKPFSSTQWACGLLTDNESA